MTTQIIPKFKPTAEILRRINGFYDPIEFTQLVNEARQFLGSTNLFGTSHKIDLSNQFYEWTSGTIRIENESFDNDPYLTHVMYMPPSDSSGLKNFCPWATPGCRAVCLGIASGRMNHGAEKLANRSFDWELTDVTKAQLKRAELFVSNRKAFIALMIVEITRHVNKAAKKGIKAASRPNGSTDILWEHVASQLFEIFPDVQFYDYTKAPLNTRANKPQNYHITYSFAETIKNQLEAEKYVAAGFNAAVVFKTDKYNLPKEFRGMPVWNGDISDERFKDPVGYYIGLTAKGAAKKDTSGFVQEVA